MRMRELKVGETYTSDELQEIMDVYEDDRLFVFSFGGVVVVVSDAGKDNYEVLAMLDLPLKYNIGG